MQLVSSLSKYFPACMPDLQQHHLQFVKDFMGKTQAIDLLFPEHKVTAYKKCHELIVAPKKSWGYKCVYELKKEKNETIEVPQIFFEDMELDAHIKESVKVLDPKIIFLGTGSMKPSKYRNVSSILV